MPTLPNDPESIAARLDAPDRPLLLFGLPGSGKSTLARGLAAAYGRRGIPCLCLSADPGTPAFGPPGALTLAEWQNDSWSLRHVEALCSLDAGRFRLPLILALRKLLPMPADGVLLVDGPGVARGIAGREMLIALHESLANPVVLVLAHEESFIQLFNELNYISNAVWEIASAAGARRPGKGARARQRTALWDAWLADGVSLTLDPGGLPLLGTPPPLAEPHTWPGRQIALLRGGLTLALGEVERLESGRLQARFPAGTRAAMAEALLVRDARRGADGLLGTAEPFVRRQPFTPAPLPPPPPGIESPPVSGRCGSLDYDLMNGVFGDPLLHLRLRHAGRSLFFDLGETGHLSARLAHQITDVFISHAHMDHLSGFQWLMRSRLGDFPACRLYGPPGIARHIAAFIGSYLWDRIETRGPAFEVAELHGDQLYRFRLQAGIPDIERLEDQPAADGLLLEDAGFRVRALELDHRTPVLAFAFEPDLELHVRRDRLQALGLKPGTWLGELKQAVWTEQPETLLDLPDGSRRNAGELAEELLLIQPGKRLVYATDLADTEPNRERLVHFARGAHTLFCEASFREQDRGNARRNGHLTTRACGEIAAAAKVGVLVPFHFSRRYQDDPGAVYEEIEAVFPNVLAP